MSMENRILSKRSTAVKPIQEQLTEIKTIFGEIQKKAETTITMGLTSQKENRRLPIEHNS